MTESGKSIRARLLNIARKENLSFQLVIIRYLQERLLYRISLSRYADNFCLKGGALLYFYSRELTRPTKDIAFLATDIPNEINFLETVLHEICSVNYPPDAVRFDTGTIVAEEIAGQDKFPGIRLFVAASFDTIRQRIQIDVCFGDVVIPSSMKLSYPTLLPESAIPIVQAYSLETVIAEKFEAMIDLSAFNSRMKDFYDVYQILATQQLNLKQLEDAIRKTFRNRNTTYSPDHALFSSTFPTDPNRLRQWKTFLVKNRLDIQLDFERVINSIKESLSPIWERMS
jgi:predicted nucleotidyltransferase component of viral defense system